MPIRRWMGAHPFKTMLIVFAIDMAFFFALSALCGCQTGPPKRFENGDATVFGPPSYGEVHEPDMAPPEGDKWRNLKG